MAETLVTGDRHYVPSPISSRERFRFSQEEGTGKLTVQITRDSGQTWTAIASEPPSNAGIGWIPTIAKNGSIKWVSPSEAFKAASSSGNNQSWIDFNFPAELQNGVVFGTFEVPQSTILLATGIQLNIFSPPEQRITVSIVSTSSGSNILGGETASLEAAQSFTNVVLPSAIQINPSTKISAKLDFNPSELFPGSYLVARLIVTRV